MTGARLILAYGAFAVIATVVNLGLQRLVLSINEGSYGFAAAVIIGTGAGLVVKYILDKRWIFNDTSTGVAAHSAKFGLYTVMGIATTAIFWGMETVFWFVWQTHAMREIGAILGLGIGYVVKYLLDRRFVFTTPEAS